MITVSEAARKIGCAVTTLHGRIKRGEFRKVVRDASGKLYLDPDEVMRATRRGRGHPFKPARELRGADFADAITRGLKPREVAAKAGVSVQDVYHEVARYKAARKDRR